MHVVRPLLHRILASALTVGTLTAVLAGPTAHGASAAIPKIVGASVTGAPYDRLCAVDSNHTVACRYGATTTITQWTGFTDAATISVGGSGGQTFACSRNTDHTVTCAGDNSYGQLGVSSPPASAPLTVPGISDAVEVATGLATTCAVRSTGAVSCWGFGPMTGNGLPTSTMRAPADVPGITNARHLAMSSALVCALLADRTVTCWGDNHHGQLGVSGASDYLPQAIANLTNVQQIAVAGTWVCALHAKKVSCWGENSHGQLGQVVNDPSSQTTPLDIPLPPAKQITLGTTGGCALLAKGAVSCWGSGHWSTPPTPAAVVSLPKVKSLLADTGFDGACVLTTKRAVYCWGAPGNPFVATTPASQGF